MALKEIADEVIKESKGLATGVYNDALKPSLEVIGKTLKKTVSLALAPIRAVVWSFEKIEKCIVDGLERRLNKVETNKVQTPDPIVAVPVVEALRYAGEKEQLRELFLNLLANSMNKDKEQVVHPSFVDVIKQLTSDEAKILNSLSRKYKYYRENEPVIDLRLVSINESAETKGFNVFQYRLNGEESKSFNGFTYARNLSNICREAGCEFERPSIYIDNLIKQNLIQLNHNGKLNKHEKYAQIMESDLFKTAVKTLKENNDLKEKEVVYVKKLFSVTDYGRAFFEACCE